MLCIGIWSYTPPQPAGHVASLHVSNLIRAANRDSLWATIVHYIIMPDSRYIAHAADHAHTQLHTLSSGNNDCSFGAFQAILYRATCHQTAELQFVWCQWSSPTRMCKFSFS